MRTSFHRLQKKLCKKSGKINLFYRPKSTWLAKWWQKIEEYNGKAKELTIAFKIRMTKPTIHFDSLQITPPFWLENTPISLVCWRSLEFTRVFSASEYPQFSPQICKFATLGDKKKPYLFENCKIISICWGFLGQNTICRYLFLHSQHPLRIFAGLWIFGIGISDS